MGRLSCMLPGVGGSVVAVALGYFAQLIYTPGDLASAVIAALAIIAAAFACGAGWFVTFLLYEESPPEVKSESTSSDEILRVYMARQKAMLEQLDESVSLLREIRDLLRGVSHEEQE